MSVTDLTGTRWLINTGTFNNSAFDTTITFYINYAIPNSTNIWKDNCDALRIGPTSITLKKLNTSNNRSDIIYDNERLWYIFDGKDVTNPELIAWFELNAVQQEFESEDYLTNTYDLTQVANTIRKTTKNYTLMSYPNGMVDLLNNIGDFWTIEQLMSTDSLGDLYYNGSRTFIPMGAFAYKRINIAEFPNVLSIDASAFYSNYRLSTISFPNCISIGSYAFYKCESLTTASFPKCTIIGSHAFRQCSSLSTISFPSCTTIGGNAFQYCSPLATVSCPNCTSIGNSAFRCCYNLISLNLTEVSQVTSLPNSNAFLSTPIDGYSAFAGQYGSIYVPASLYDAFTSATNWTYFSSRMVSV